MITLVIVSLPTFVEMVSAWFGFGAPIYNPFFAELFYDVYYATCACVDSAGSVLPFYLIEMTFFAELGLFSIVRTLC